MSCAAAMLLFSKVLDQPDIEDTLMIRCGGREIQFDSMVQPGEQLLLLTPISGGKAPDSRRRSEPGSRRGVE